MAGDGTSFEIDLPVTGTSGVNAAATALDALASRLTAAAAASTQAAEAVKVGEASYKQAENAADAAAKAVEKIGLAVDAQRGKLQQALDAGDGKGAERAASKLQNLIARQGEAVAKARESADALGAEAASLDRLKASAAQASAAEAQLSKAHQQATASAAAMAKATAKAKGSGDFNQLADGVKKLGGPLGKAADVAGDASEGLDKLSASLGGAGIYVAVAAVAATAIIAVSAAAIKGTASILKWGIALADTGKQLDKISKRFDATVAKTFGGLKIDRLLAGLDQLVDLFDESTVTGKAMKVVFESLFQPLIDGLVSLVPYIVRTFIQFEIWVLKALIAIKPFGSYFVTAGKIIGIAALVIGAALAVVIGAFVAVGAAMAVALGYVLGGTSLFVEFGKSIREGVGSALEWVTVKFNEAIAFLSGVSLTEIGTQLITGLAEGITSGGAAVLSSITGVVGGAIDGAKKLLGIASPSKVFAEIGANTAEGMATGVEGSTGNVQSSLESMVSPPSADASASKSGASSAGASANLAGATFNFYGVQGAEDAVSRFAEVVTKILEGDAAQLGVEVPS